MNFISNNITILGAGTMGNGIAQVFAGNNYKVTLYDVNELALSKALETIDKNIKRIFSKTNSTDFDSQSILRNIIMTTVLKEAVSNADLIIEVISENFEAKKGLLISVDGFAKKDCIIASNTSSISITKLGSLLNNPQRFIGMHFMNPVPIMPLIEVICGIHTAENTLSEICRISESLGKTPLIVQDYPGFVANRILMPMINEAIITFNQGIASIETIDQMMKLGMAHPMGPLELADFIGLDTCLSILSILQKELGSDKYAPSPLLVKMVDAKLLGKKTGEGFYIYNNDDKSKIVNQKL